MFSFFKFLILLNFILVQNLFAEVTPEILKEKFDRYSESIQIQKTNGISWAQSKPLNRKFKGSILISTGRTESILGWYEPALFWIDQGYEVFIIEHRGQGQSDRPLLNTDKGHIQDFSDYVNDFSYFVHQIFLKKAHPPYFLLANSMGAPIALLSNPSEFQAIILYAPMFKINTGFIPEPAAQIIIKSMINLGLSDWYAPGAGPYKKTEFSQNQYSNSKIRYDFDHEILANNKNLQVGGPTVSWVNEAFKVPDLLKEKLTKMSLPTFIFQAQEEYFVSNKSQNEFCSMMLKCEVILVKNSKHVFHLDQNEVLQKVLKKSLEIVTQIQLSQVPSLKFLNPKTEN